MKRILFFMTSERGFFLPYVLFVVAIVFIAITANVNMYTQEIELTKSHIDQLKIETLMQMGREQLKDELIKARDSSGTVYYNFLDGDVDIGYEQKSDEEYYLNFKVYLKDENVYKMSTYLWMDE